MATVGKLVIEMSANVARLQKDMAAARGHVATTTKGINSALNVTKNALAALGLGFGVMKFGRFIQGILDSQDALSKLSQKLNISVETLAGLQHAADLAGVSSEGLTKGFKSLATIMYDAASGLKESQRYFASLNVEVKNTDGSLRNTEDVMVEVADKFRAMADGTAKTALAVKLFGRAGLDLIPMLNEGSDALRQMIAEGKRLNPVTAESARQAEVFNDNVTRLSKALKTGFIAAVNESLPRMQAMSEEFAKTASEGSALKAVLIGIAQALNWSDPKSVTLQKEMIGIAERTLEIESNISRLRAKGPRWNDQVQQEKERLAALHARAKVISALLNPVNPSNYDARDLRLYGNKPPVKPAIIDETAANAAKKAAADALKEKERYRKLDNAGWIAYIEAQTAEYEEGLLAQAALSDEHFANEERLRKLDAAGWVAYIEAQTAEYEQGLRDQADALDRSAEKTEQAARDLGLTFSSAFEDAIAGGKDLGDVLKALEKDIARIVLRKTITEPIAGGISKYIGGIDFGSFMPKFASGTDYVPETGPAIVHKGERIIPAGQNAGGGGVTVNVSMNAIDARNGVQFLAQHKATIGAIIEQAYLRGGRRSGMTL